MRDDIPGHVNRFDGSASAHTVVQAGEVSGGVHFHHQVPLPAPVIVPHQLRSFVRHFVNRSEERTRLSSLVADRNDEPHAVRVAAITGTAGVGKTSLALHWAHSIRPHFPGGELYANLRGYTAGSPATPQEILGRFLEDLGVPATHVPAEPERRETMFRSLVAERRMPLVLDNAADSSQVRPLLPATSGCLVMVTSRDDLSGLVRQEGALRLDVTTFPTTDAVELLRAATADYRTSDRRGDLAALARLCAGLPLALRIAAERAAGWPSMPLGELIDDLRDESARWSVLTAEAEEGSDAMRSIFEWSYRALSDPAARLFRRLGLYPGNEFGLPAAASLTGSDPAMYGACWTHWCEPICWNGAPPVATSSTTCCGPMRQSRSGRRRARRSRQRSSGAASAGTSTPRTRHSAPWRRSTATTWTTRSPHPPLPSASRTTSQRWTGTARRAPTSSPPLVPPLMPDSRRSRGDWPWYCGPSTCTRTPSTTGRRLPGSASRPQHAPESSTVRRRHSNL
ncbi:ATP-binding protein [Streptomyces turgidiscabies]|uniref:ATP-binding protein n=1 Tax=Streptomyces turgidiscabies TaxID=85558 RepID=UPI0035901E5F